MEILTKLGIDHTFYYQFAIFCIAYLALSRLLFKPYLKAYHKRIEATFGNQEQAEKLKEAVKDLHIEYETKAKEVNSKVQSFFEEAHREAQYTQAQILGEARNKAEGLVAQRREAINLELQKSKQEIKKYVPELSQEITKKILGRI